MAFHRILPILYRKIQIGERNLTTRKYLERRKLPNKTFKGTCLTKVFNDIFNIFCNSMYDTVIATPYVLVQTIKQVKKAF